LALGMASWLQQVNAEFRRDISGGKEGLHALESMTKSLDTFKDRWGCIFFEDSKGAYSSVNKTKGSNYKFQENNKLCKKLCFRYYKVK
jgi:hypothetical protein